MKELQVVEIKDSPQITGLAPTNGH